MTYKNIPFGEIDKFNVLVEISAGSPIKYEYYPDQDKIVADFVFKDGFKFKYNYGLIFGTQGGDKDHLDVIILADQSLEQGKVIQCRAIGIINVLDRGEVDNKILAVQIDDQSKNNLQSVEDLPQQLLEDFREFYNEVARQKNKIHEIIGFGGKEQALEEIKKSLISL